MSDGPGARIKYLRTLAVMSQEELGRRVGLQRAAINKYEKGSVTNIPISTIEKIAKVFDVSPAFIVGWDNLKGSPLTMEVKVIEGVHYYYGKEAVDLLETFTTLNNKGRERVIQYCHEMDEIYNIDA